VRNGFRLGCNRDERRDRAPALPPAVHGLSHRTAIFPVDPAGQGTWVGVTDTRLAAALLNRSADSTAPLDKSRRPSRGLIIPYLVERPRRRLFERIFAGEERSWVQAQNLFHRHQWQSRPGISVRMERADAKTVSQTFVSVTGSAIELRYRALESAEFDVVTGSLTC